MTLPITVVFAEDGSPISVTCDVCGLLVPFFPGRNPDEYGLIEHGCFPAPSEPEADVPANPPVDV